MSFRSIATRALAALVVPVLLLTGCSIGPSPNVKPFVITVESAKASKCDDIAPSIAKIEDLNTAKRDSDKRNELRPWGIDPNSDASYTTAHDILRAQEKICNDATAKASIPTQSASTSPSATPSTTPSSTATSASASTTATPVYCWGALQKRLSGDDWSTLLKRIDDAKDQLNFSSADVMGWTKLNVDCRVIVAFDSKLKEARPTDDATRSVAAKKIGGGSLASVSVVQAEGSVQVAGEARINLSGDSGVKVILPRIVNGKSVPSSGVVISQEDTGGSSYILLAGIIWLK